MILQGVFTANMMWAAVAASGIVLGAAYMLWLYQRTMFGKIENPKNENLRDLNLREVVTFVPLIILAFWIGIYPTPFLDRLDTSVNRVIARVSPQYIDHLAAKPADCAQPAAAASKFTQPACGDEAVSRRRRCRRARKARRPNPPCSRPRRP